jgi:hypothetical protein
MTTPRRRRKAPQPPPLEVSAAELEAFIGAGIDADRAGAALERACAAAEAFIGQPIPDPCPHPIRQGIFLYASQLLLLADDSPAAEPSLIVRAMWRNHVSAAAG